MCDEIDFFDYSIGNQIEAHLLLIYYVNYYICSLVNFLIEELFRCYKFILGIINGSVQRKASTINPIHYIPTQSIMDSVLGAEHSVQYNQVFTISGLAISKSSL